MKNISTTHPTITENMEDIFMKCAPHILVCESHNDSISAMSNSFHNIISCEVSMRSLCLAMKSLRATANRHLYVVVKKEWGTCKDSTIMQAL